MLQASAAWLEAAARAPRPSRPLPPGRDLGLARPRLLCRALPPASPASRAPQDSASGTEPLTLQESALGLTCVPQISQSRGPRPRSRLPPRFFPRRAGLTPHQSGGREARLAPRGPGVGAVTFLSGVSLPSLCRRPYGPQQEALPALHGRLVRQLRCLQVRCAASCAPPPARGARRCCQGPGPPRMARSNPTAGFLPCVPHEPLHMGGGLHAACSWGSGCRELRGGLAAPGPV